jgi:DNA-binding CsgD family transcriptional regulator
MSRQSEIARRAGALSPLAFTLNGNVHVATWRGDLAAAAALAAEADAVMDATGIRQAPMGALLLAALRGDEPQSSTFIETTINRSKLRGEGMSVQVGHWTTAILCNGLARYEQALSHALQACEEGPELFVAGWALPELIEAAVRTGNEARAADAIERLAESTQPSETDWGRGILARSQALVSDGETAEDLYREASECFSRIELRPERARSHLLHGEWLRRQKRRVDARDQLQSAYDTFSEIGMVAFAERARRELRATGATVRKRREDTRDDLTAQEQLIGRLAAEGLTNPEIGAQLFLSPRTVEWHLRKVFTKLGVSSRRGLRDVLPARAAVPSRD